MLNFQNGTDRNMEPRTPACSRAIMLLTDGALSDYQDAFINGTKLFDPMGEQTDIGISLEMVIILRWSTWLVKLSKVTKYVFLHI